ncbi:hypothetical protein FA13DRAFT_1749790 [Coprinellus micaceus]|uniref:CST complex subunit STN1 n=1 Tax=Coprinellus micaceus TaxID=71717 RepID=A0A4Y7RI83_COPMI|nr:hypothetical protein FA13DRAFT_1749790 [Coprinellus micaceus]
MSRNNNMSSTTTLASTPTKLKRTYSLMLSPSKDSQQVDAKPSKTAPTQQQIFSWTLTPDALASCHVRDVLSLQERTESAPTNKHAGSDFYWLGRVPCRNVRVMGLVVEVTQYELRALYTVDDGTGVLECVQRTPAVKRMPEPGKPPPILPEYLPPAANVGDSVCVVGRAQRKGEFWQVTIDSIERSSSINDELKHYLAVRRLHETHYDLEEPFEPPIPEKHKPEPAGLPTPMARKPPAPSDDAGLSTPTKKPALSTRLPRQAESSRIPAKYAALPRSKAGLPSTTPTKLRHPSRLQHIELTQNTFRIYLKYFMDNGPTHHNTDHDDDFDPFSTSFLYDPSTPTKDSTPRPTGFSKRTAQTRPSIEPIDFTLTPRKEQNTLRGYSISYLRRVPELALLAHRVAKQENRAARKVAKTRPSNSSKPPSSAMRQPSTPTPKDVKRLFIRAVNELYREGSIVIWDCPSHPCSDLSPGDSSFLWKMSTSIGPSANTTTSTLPPTHTEDNSGNLSDPDRNEDVYVPLTPSFLGSQLEGIIPIVQKAERARQPPGKNNGAPAYSGASTEGMVRYLKRKDDRWAYLHVDSVEAALGYLDGEGRAWMCGQEQWQLTV